MSTINGIGTKLIGEYDWDNYEGHITNKYFVIAYIPFIKGHWINFYINILQIFVSPSLVSIQLFYNIQHLLHRGFFGPSSF